MNMFFKHLVLATTLAASPCFAQDAASRASAASVESLSVLPAAALDLLSASGKFTVIALRPVGHALKVVLRTAEASGEIVVEVSSEAVRTSALAVGTSIEVSATTAGFLLSAGGIAIAFVPSALVADMVHRAEILR